MGRAKRWAWWLGGGTVVFVGVVALGVLLLFRDSATPITREEATFGLGTIESGTGVGDSGLYVYETTGFETASALGGGRHDYPTESYLSIRPGECGTVHRWQVLEERWAEWHVCDDGTLGHTVLFHQWFGLAETGVYPCGDGARLAPEGDETTWSFTCVEEATETRIDWVYEVIGTESVVVAGEEIETLHLVATETNSGRTVGSGTHHRWILTDPYLVVKERVAIDNTTESPVGGVDYVERYEILLTSLVPSE